MNHPPLISEYIYDTINYTWIWVKEHYTSLLNIFSNLYLKSAFKYMVYSKRTLNRARMLLKGNLFYMYLYTKKV